MQPQNGQLTGMEKQYFYDHAGRLIAEETSSTFYESAATTERIVFLYDESGIIGMRRTLNGTTSYYYFKRNLLGDVTAIYNSSGTMVAKYLYDAYGNCTYSGTTSIALANPIRYRGYYYDDDIGLYYLNSRYYSPKWRRFLSPTTSTITSSAVNGLNAYIYANNNPISIAYNSANTASTTDCRMVSPIVDSFVASYPRARPNAINIFRGLRWPQFTTKDIAKDISVSLGEVWGRVVWGFTREGRTFSEIHSLLEGINGYTVFDNLPSITGMVFKGIGIGMMGLDVVEAGINSYKSGHSFVQGAVNVLLTLGKNFLAYYATTAIGTSVGMWTGAKLGASLGAYAGPVGFAIGALIGAGVGILIDAFGDVVIDWVVGWFD